MKIQITGRHLEITSALRSHVEEKLSKLDHHFDNILDLQVVLHVEKDSHFAEAKLSVPGDEIVAKAEGENMYMAIDMLRDKLDRQVVKHKQKLKSHHRSRHDKYDALNALDLAGETND